MHILSIINFMLPKKKKKNQDPDMVFTGLQFYLEGSELPFTSHSFGEEEQQFSCSE